MKLLYLCCICVHLWLILRFVILMDLFLHPWYMAAGGVLVSAPIIIHLINRMRFKRIRWAAMEFLLKSQKRNRRRLIIEQMILLPCAVLLVLLAGFLVARFVGAKPTGQGATHVVVIDDTPSMADQFADKGPKTNSFEVAREQIKQLAHSAAQRERINKCESIGCPISIPCCSINASTTAPPMPSTTSCANSSRRPCTSIPSKG